MKKYSFIVTFVIMSFLAPHGEADARDIHLTGTDVGGIISTDTTWTLTGSPYNMIANVQIDTPAILTIEPGVVVNGNGLIIQTWGTLHAVGTSDNYIQFNQTHLEPGSTSTNISPFLLEIRYADVYCGRIYSASGNSVYGSLTLTDSHLWNIDDFIYLWYPVADSFIERNTFYMVDNKPTEISVGGTNDGAKVYVRNNTFFSAAPYSGNEGLIDNWASSSSSDMVVEYNSFLNNDRVAVSVSTSGQMGAINNFWNSTDTNVIESMILDINDDLSRPSYIEYAPFLTEPHPDTPEIVTTNILLDNDSLEENMPVSTEVGNIISTVSPNPCVSFTYELVEGIGDTDNDSFTIVGDILQTTEVFNFEAQSSYSIRVRVTDSWGLTFDKVFAITVIDIIEVYLPLILR